MQWFLKTSLMAAATLACLVPYNFHRKKVAVNDAGARKLPRPEWFSALVQNHGLEHLLSQKLQPVPAPTELNERTCIYLVKLVADVEYKGPLTPWDRECRFLWEYFGYPADAFTLKVSRCFKFTAPVKLGFAKQRFAGLVQVANVPSQDIERTGAQCISGNAQQILQGAELQRALGISAEQWAAFVAKPVSFGVPHVIAKLIGRAAWSKLLVLASWSTRRLFAVNLLCENLQFPSQVWLRQLRLQNKLGTSAPPPDLKFGPEHAQQLAFKIRRAAPLLVNAFEGEEELVLETFEWEQLVSRLDSFCRATGSSHRKVAELPDGGHMRRGNRFDITTVVGTLAAAMHLRNRHELKDIVKQIMATVFEEFDFDDSVWEKIPSASTLSRSQLLVDAAHCCFMRQRFREQTFRMYLLADSSPQAGQDYLLSTALMIACNDLEKCVAASSYMRSSWQELVEAYKRDDHETFADIVLLRNQHGMTLASCINVHRFLPMALGSGASGLEHKTTALARAIFAETQSVSDLQSVLSQVVSMTSDMGTEMFIADMAGFTLREILPTWAVDADLELDVDAGGAEQLQADVEGFFLPRGVAVPGLNHIIDNMRLGTQNATMVLLKCQRQKKIQRSELRGKTVRTAMRARDAAQHGSELEEDVLAVLAASSRELGLDGNGDGRKFLPCPLAGLRAVELASGAMEEHLLHLFNLSKETLLAELAPMPEDETVSLLQEFERGKSHMVATFTNKLQHWNMLPWKLAALADSDEAKARQTASNLVRSFDESEQREELHHRLTWFWMKTSPRVREQLDAFVSGRPLASLPELHRAVRELSFIPIAGASNGLRNQFCKYVSLE
ncbi:unnamed protein product [Symbiodinium pilosum]|uniref:Uncharacterized protein n=1 Tax=Symbiodinium pilosum TaxID=2952 RepID=A0A812JKD5_SYMPI|nr:unnamed protein product [Symbiodinium pilosum]